MHWLKLFLSPRFEEKTRNVSPGHRCPRCFKVCIFIQNQMTFLRTKENNSKSHKMIWIILELEQDILMLSIVSKFRYVPFEITRVRDVKISQTKGNNSCRNIVI